MYTPKPRLSKDLIFLTTALSLVVQSLWNCITKANTHCYLGYIKVPLDSAMKMVIHAQTTGIFPSMASVLMIAIDHATNNELQTVNSARF